MEFGSIEREVYIEASAEVVFEVISSPEHISHWWNGAETELSATPGQVTEVAWGRTRTSPISSGLLLSMLNRLTDSRSDGSTRTP
ncbi:SRPBCC domain-containing protein [Nesterenkonia ebinurensis]|uniref:SRPBCC domain-containing protein n=1 Tax=Nesterenkonia ebinurensis TaxID=2608252 RepID=UPI0021DF63C2|nr:SRPBCC domain-containing protein [Nesterenkonia ebinurensis]